MSRFFKPLFKVASVGLFGLALAGCASTSNQGQFMPNNNPDSIRLLPVGVVPGCGNYATIGTVSVSTLNAMGNQRSQGTMEQALRYQAAAVGGTAVMNVQVSGDKFTGTAIHCM